MTRADLVLPVHRLEAEAAGGPEAQARIVPYETLALHELGDVEVQRLQHRDNPYMYVD
jgi:hypothetical protein